MQEAKTKIFSREDYQTKLEDSWLQQIYDQGESEEKDPNRKLVDSAKLVLQKSVSEDHVAWVRLCCEAFRALPIEDKKEMLPVLLEQLARVWAVAPQVSRSLEALSVTSAGGSEMIELVSDRLTNKSACLPDYAVSWILHAFWNKAWKGKEILASLDPELSLSQAAARRELLIALRHTAVADSIAFNRRDVWQHRAYVWAT